MPPGASGFEAAPPIVKKLVHGDFEGEGASFEFAAGCGLFGADAAAGDFGFEIVFAFDGGAREAPKHGDLTDVIEGIGDRCLEEALDGSVKRFIRREVIVECFEGGEEAIEFRVPGERSGIVPGLLALSDGKRPIK